MISTVNDHDIHIRFAKPSGAGETAKASADDDNASPL
ncbi:hypothetical protein SAMN05421750_1203 [Agrobacterium pusense]|nr:hypothetical protein SAMN05421750_1203 [Agrobacterium pusense]